MNTGTLPFGTGDRLTNTGTQTTTLHGWKIVKNHTTCVRVIHRLGVQCRIETTLVEVQCIASTEVVSTQLKKSNPAENTATKEQPGRHEIQKAQAACKDLALDPVVCNHPILQTFIGIQAPRHPPHETSITKLVVVISHVIIWGVTQFASKKQLFLLWSFCLMIGSVHAEDPNASCKLDPNALETHDFAEAVAVTLLIVVLTVGGAGVARWMCNRWRALPVVPVPAFDIMDGLTRSPVATHSNSIFDIPPELA